MTDRTFSKEKNGIWRIAAVCVCAVAALSMGWPFPFGASAKAEKWRAKTEALGSELIRTHNAEAEKARERIGKIFLAAKQEVPPVAEQAAAPFLGFKATAGNVWLLAGDTIRGTDHFQSHAAAACKPAIEWQAGVAAKLGFELERLEQSLAAADNGFRRAVLDFSGDAGEAAGMLELDDEGFRKMIETQNNLTGSVAGASAAVALEAIFIRATITSIRIVVAAVVKRITETAAAAGTSVVVDGPLPIGDAIAAVISVGGAVWTAFDLRAAAEAMIQLKPSMEKQLRESLEKLEHDTLERINASVIAHSAVTRIR